MPCWVRLFLIILHVYAAKFACKIALFRLLLMSPLLISPRLSEIQSTNVCGSIPFCPSSSADLSIISRLIFAKLGSFSSLLAEVARPFLSVAFPFPFVPPLPLSVLVVVEITLLRDLVLLAKSREVDLGLFISVYYFPKVFEKAFLFPVMFYSFHYPFGTTGLITACFDRQFCFSVCMQLGVAMELHWWLGTGWKADCSIPGVVRTWKLIK